MQSAADLIVGKKDFSAFMSPGSDVTDTVRNVFYVKVLKNGTDIDVKICADGFLYNMVRIIVGTLIEVAYDRMKPEDINDVIDSCDRRNAGMTAPPEGLYLNKVSY
jgi:tRNA pseudouridine38-40 synthase